MKRELKKGLNLLTHLLIKLMGKTRVGQYLHNQYLTHAMLNVTKVMHNDTQFSFSTPNRLTHWRAETFSSKEPETLEWIDKMPAGSVLWDIGANIGLYSIYAAKARGCEVLAFEPSVFNLELLARNIYLNDVVDKIAIAPVPLSNSIGLNEFKMTSTTWGGALSTFGEEIGWDGQEIKPVFKYKTFGMGMNDFIDFFSVTKPDYIKMDVDGIEHFILKGGQQILKEIKGILIEVNDDFHAQAEQCKKLLTESGLSLKEKRQSEIISSSTTGFQNGFNQIWARE